MSHLKLGRFASQASCAVQRETGRFQATDAQVFLGFQARGLKSGDAVRVDWIGPKGDLDLTTEHPPLPPGPLPSCFLTQMPIAGYPAASQSGHWTVRVLVNQTPLAERTFSIEGGASPGAPRISGLHQQQAGERTRLTITGSGFDGESLVHFARYSEAGGWQYFQHLLPEKLERGRMELSYPALEAGEYLLVVANSAGAASLPHRLLLNTPGYKLPTEAGVPWVLTQGPGGGFSHWGNSRQAYDIAPRTSRQIVAMRSGIVYARDAGLRQNLASRGFGNYITIDHQDGYYSHYAHLAAGTFLVRSGERVEQGQPLAAAGTSGFSFGTHVHVHVTREFSIASQSIPFAFDDIPARTVRGQPVVVSSNTAPLAVGGAPVASSSNPPPSPGIERKFQAGVAVEQWWSGLVTAPPDPRSLWIRMSWTGRKNSVELYITSPCGKTYGPGADESGFSVSGDTSRLFQLPAPEPGIWRVSALGTHGEGSIPFQVHTVFGVKSARIR